MNITVTLFTPTPPGGTAVTLDTGTGGIAEIAGSARIAELRRVPIQQWKGRFGSNDSLGALADSTRRALILRLTWLADFLGRPPLQMVGIGYRRGSVGESLVAARTEGP